jgi:hypothetical protein
MLILVFAENVFVFAMRCNKGLIGGANMGLEGVGGAKMG